MKNIKKNLHESGMLIGEDNKIYNKVDLFKASGITVKPVGNANENITQFPAKSGRIIGKDNKLYNEVDLFKGLTQKIVGIEEEVEDLSKLTKWLGVTNTPITENSTVNPIMISGIAVTAKSGDITKYGNDNFKFTDVGTWQYYYDNTDVYTKDETDELLDEKLDTAGGQLTGQVTTTQTAFTEDNQLVTKKYVDDNAGSGTTVYEIGTPDYDNRIQFTQADLPYTVPCDGYLYIGGWQSRVSLKYKDADDNYVSMAFASTSGAIAEYGMYPVTKGMVLEYNEIDGTEAKMYIVPMEYNAMSIGRGVEELYVASDTTAPNTITLSQPYTNFDELMFIRHWGSPATSEASFANVADVNVGDVVGVANWVGGKFVEYTVTSTTVLTKTDSGQDGYIYKIYGIKYASKYAKVDDEMSATSENPVQNKVVKDYIDTLFASIVNGNEVSY